MCRRSLLVAYGGPGLVTLVAAVFYATLGRDAWWGVVPPATAMLTAPLWPWVALRFSRDADCHADLTTALNFDLTMLAGLAAGAVLLLVFVGLVVMVAVTVFEVVFCLDSARRIWSGEPVIAPKVIHFVK